MPRIFALRVPPVTPLVTVLAGLCALVSVGCGPRNQISEYTVRTEKALLAENRLEEQILGAVVRKDDRAWFFKIRDAKPKVNAVKDAFETFVKSIRFNDDGKPEWTLPEGWTSTEETGLRFATLNIETGSETDPDTLEVSVIPLPVSDGSWDDYLKDNINRWRNQLGLSPLNMLAKSYHDPSKDTDGVVQFELSENSGADPNTVYVVSIVGSGGDDSMSAPKPPFAGTAPTTSQPPSENNGPMRPTVTASAEPILKAPDNWTKSQNDQFSAAAYEVVDGDESLRITVTSLGGGAGALLPNVNRWRRQVGLDPVDDSTVGTVTEPITVDGQPGHLMFFDGAENALYGAIVPQGGRIWFFKLIGPPKLAAQEQAAFADFVRSAKFE